MSSIRVCVSRICAAIGATAQFYFSVSLQRKAFHIYALITPDHRKSAQCLYGLKSRSSYGLLYIVLRTRLEIYLCSLIRAILSNCFISSARICTGLAICTNSDISISGPLMRRSRKRIVRVELLCVQNFGMSLDIPFIPHPKYLFSEVRISIASQRRITLRYSLERGSSLRGYIFGARSSLLLRRAVNSFILSLIIEGWHVRLISVN